ncbi:MAG: DUF4013 domain-containing protein [Candidatus Promineifilaceae bacterium]|jgi:hypothetical protein
MDIGKSLTYLFDDDRWVVKLLIGTGLMILSFLIIPIFFVQGYLVKIVRNMLDGLENPLPEWEDWGKLFMDGLYLTIAGIVYSAPVWLLMICGMAVFLPAGLTEGDLSSTLVAAGGVGFMLLTCLAMILGVAISLLYPAITVQYAREDNLGACFRFSEIIAMTRENLGDVIIALLVLFGLGIVLGLLGVIPLIGWVIALVASFYTTVVSGHLFGQIGRNMVGGKEKSFDSPLTP